MATTIYFRNVAPDYGLGYPPPSIAGVVPGAQPAHLLAMTDARGAAAVSDTPRTTVTGPTTGLEVWDATAARVFWLSDPIDADVTVAGTMTFNLRMAENSMSANAGAHIRIYRVLSNGDIGALIVNSERAVEFGTAEAANNWTAAPTSTAMLKGDRFLVIVGINDVGTMATGFTCTFWYNGPTAAASGDSYISFTETFGLSETTPAGSKLFLAEEARPVNGNAYGRKMWTPRGDGVASEAVTPLTYARGLDSAARIETPAPLFSAASRLTISTGASLNAEAAFSFKSHVAQSFIPGRESCVGVQFWIFHTGAPTMQIIAELRPDVAGSPGSTVLATGTWPNDYYINGRNYEIIFTEPARVDPTATYWIVLRPSTGPNEFNYYNLGGSLTNDYANGLAKNSTDGAAWTTNATILDLHLHVLSDVLEWYTPRLKAFTLADLVRCNLRAKANTTGLDTAIHAELAVVNGDGSGAVVWAAGNACGTTWGEMTATEAAQIITLAGDDLAVADGKRLRLRAFYNNTEVDRSSAVTVTFYWDGTADGATGDSWIQLSQTVEAQESIPAVGFSRRHDTLSRR